MEVIPDLHLIEGSRSNIYLWLGDGGPFLVDSGMPGDQKLIYLYLTENGLDLRDLNSILVTHADLDHVGSASKLQERSGAKIYCGSQTATLLIEGNAPKHMPWLVHALTTVYMKSKRVPANAIKIISDNEFFLGDSDWQAIATPGHTSDHFSFFNATRGILFAGDALNTRNNQLGSSPKRITADWNAAVGSAKRLLVLHPAVIGCGHGKPFVGHEAGAVFMLHRALG